MEKKEDTIVRGWDAPQSSMSILDLNNLVVSMRPLFKKVKGQITQKMTRQIKKIRSKRPGTEEQLATKEKKINQMVEEIAAIKKLNADSAIKFTLNNELPFNKLASQGDMEKRCLGRIATHRIMLVKVEKWRHDHDDWKSLAAFILSKNTGRRFKKKKKSKTVEKKVENKQNTESDVKDQVNDNQEKQLTERVLKHTLSLESTTVSDCSQSKGQIASSKHVNVNEKSREKNIVTKEITGKNSDSISDDCSSSADESGESVECFEESSDDETSARDSDKNSVSLEQGDVRPTDKIETVEISPDKNLSSKEMVVKRIRLEDFGEDDVIEENTDSNIVSFLFQSDSSRSERKRDPFFADSNSEESDADEEPSVNSVIENKKQDPIDKIDNRHFSRKSLNSEFVGSLSGRGQHYGRQSGTNSKQSNWKNKGGKTAQGPAAHNRMSQREKQFKQHPDSGRNNEKTKHGFNASFKTAAQPRHSSTTDDHGAKLHPSWEASKHRKQAMQLLPFKGKKITFDD